MSLTGGMENWGLITYRDATLLVATDSIASERQYVASVVCHELAHQWFGDIVTMVRVQITRTGMSTYSSNVE